MATPVKSGLFAPLGYEQISDVSSAVGLTVPANARYAVIQVLDTDVRWRDDGTDPTASVGMAITAGSSPFFYNGNLATIKFIEAEASAEINVSYYGD